ncbi:MAG: hypothetical protein BWY94_02021 [Actinobacteria bacterium ADurb.BinA094]|nr:MAG: hypothetical protein BWY94_02021 [Actinobacteria bacterium ADurb.BinA094]
MGGEAGRADVDRAVHAKLARDPQLLRLVGDVEAIAGLDLQRGDALGHQQRQPSARGSQQFRLARRAGGPHGGGDAAGPCREHERSVIHEAVVPVAAAAARQRGVGHGLQILRPEVVRQPQLMGQHATDVGVHRGHVRVMGEDEHGAGGVRADARQRLQPVERARQPGAGAGGRRGPGHGDGAPVQAQRPVVVAEALPAEQDFAEGRRREALEVGPDTHPFLVTRDHPRHRRLLQHDLADQDRVRVGGPSPRKVAAVLLVPAEQPSAQRAEAGVRRRERRRGSGQAGDVVVSMEVSLPDASAADKSRAAPARSGGGSEAVVRRRPRRPAAPRRRTRFPVVAPRRSARRGGGRGRPGRRRSPARRAPRRSRRAVSPP